MIASKFYNNFTSFPVYGQSHDRNPAIHGAFREVDPDCLPFQTAKRRHISRGQQSRCGA
jgi:hypothetical protein